MPLIAVLVVVANAGDVGAAASGTAAESGAVGESGTVSVPMVMERPPAFSGESAEARLGAIPAPEKNPKLSSHLLRLIEAEKEAKAAGRAVTGSVESLPAELRGMAEARLLRIDDRGFAQVFVHPVGNIEMTAAVVEAAAGTVERVDVESGVVQAQVPITRLEALSADPAVRLVRLPNYGFTQVGSKQTEGDAILRANLARSSFSVDGTGVRVGVISDGVGGLGSSQGSGDLGAVNTSTCNVTGINPQLSGAEGTAMLEIVHDLAPGAELWFGNFSYGASGLGTEADFRAAVDCLALNTDVVVDDIGWFGVGPYDGTSVLSANTSTELNRSTNRIRAYSTSVANQATSHYQEAYTPFSNTTFHQFSATGATGDVSGFGAQPADPLLLGTGGKVTVILQWNDLFGGSANDYDLYLVRNSDGALVQASEDPQTGSQYPVEVVTYTNSGAAAQYNIQINKFSGAARTFDMFILCSGCFALGGSGGPIHNYNTIGSSVPSQSDAGGGVISVGAVNAADPGNDSIAPYSSRGPTNDGRTKPDITGIDGVSVTGNGGFPSTFYGTSAASPHIGGIAALLLQCHPSLKTGDALDNPAADKAAVRDALLNGSIDLGAGGMDNVYGSGRADAVNAMNTLGPVCCGAPPTGGGALPALPPGYYHPLTPARILDTRPVFGGPIGGPAGKLGHACVKSVQATGVGGVPAVGTGVSAVVVNVTVTEPTAPSHLTIYPSDGALPNAANLNFVGGLTVPNLVTVRVGADGMVNVFNNSGQTHLIFDVVGWYDATPEVDTMAIDMNSAGNAKTSLGTRELCAQINENDVQDANETGVDTLTIDVTAENIPPYNDAGTPGNPGDDTGGILGFAYDFTYPSANLTVATEDANFLLTATPPSAVFPASEPLPDDNVNNFWQSSQLDTGTGVPEWGRGVLSRLTISSEESAVTAGQYLVSLENSSHLDASGVAVPPQTVYSANVAINQACGTQVTPSPTPTVSPTPTPGPGPGPAATGYGFYHPVVPYRILETRGAPYATIGVPAPGKIGAGPGGSIDVPVTGVAGSSVPSMGVTAVVVNTTVTEPTAPSHLTIYPTGVSLPNAANLNFVANQTVPNLAIVKVGAGGKVTIFNNSGQTHVIFDIVGWYGSAPGGSLFSALQPTRILETRGAPYETRGVPGAGKIGAGDAGAITVDVTNTYSSGVPDPAGVTAVIVNTTVTEPTAPSHLTVYPSNASVPNAANLNFVAGLTVPNLVMVKIAPDGTVRIRNNSGSTHVIFDVVGYFGPAN